MNPFDFSAQILRKKFAVGARARLRRFGDALTRLERDAADLEALAETMRHAQALAGAAGTYGFPKVAETARELEQRCSILLNQRMPPMPREIARWREALDRLRTDFGMESAGLVDGEGDEADEAPQLNALVVHAWGQERDRLTKVLTAEGMAVRVAADRATARRIVREQLPDVLIVDASVQGGTGVQVVEYVRSLPQGEHTAVVIVNSQSGTWDKVKAVRHGADALLGRGAVPAQIVSGVLGLVRKDKGEGARILYVEPDPDQSAFVARLLESAGYRVTVCRDPAQFEAMLSARRPDLVLTEVVLPGVRAFDLIRVVRQDRDYQTMPVLFLTTESQVPSRMEGLNAGGDDFLVKPVEPQVLLSTIESRLERARLQASLSERDHLSGMYNHSTFVMKLEAWLQGNDSPDVPCTLAIVDVRGMAQLNARHGHGSGDQVLRELAQLLKDKLRAGRLFGRFGSDDLAVLLYDMDESRAVDLLEELRVGFASVERFTPAGRGFRADFDAGVARFSHATKLAHQWLEQAEKAAKTAREGASGRVMAASRAAPRKMTIPTF